MIKKWNKELLLPILLCLICLAVVFYFSFFGLNPHHDGIMLKTAIDVARGKVLFRDSFTQYGALTTYVQALFILIFGEHLWAIRLSTAVFYTLSYLFVFLIVRRFTNSRYAFGSVIVLLLLAYFYGNPYDAWSNVYALFFLIVTAYLLLTQTSHIDFSYAP